MAIYNFEMKPHKRSAGHNAVDGVAYRDRSVMKCESTGRRFNHTRKKDRVFSEIYVPAGSPGWAKDPATLFNSIEQFEKRADATLGMEYEIALPYELGRLEQIALIDNFVIQMSRLFPGAVFHVGMHEKKLKGGMLEKLKNPHIHLWRSDRPLENGVWGKKNKKWTQLKALHGARKLWADVCNKHLAAAGLDARIDHRSLADRGSDMEPMLHVGRGYRNEERKRENEAIAARNKEREDFAHELARLQDESRKTRQVLDRIESEIIDLTTSLSAALKGEHHPVKEIPAAALILARDLGVDVGRLIPRGGNDQKTPELVIVDNKPDDI